MALTNIMLILKFGVNRSGNSTACLLQYCPPKCDLLHKKSNNYSTTKLVDECPTKGVYSILNNIEVDLTTNIITHDGPKVYPVSTGLSPVLYIII